MKPNYLSILRFPILNHVSFTFIAAFIAALAAALSHSLHLPVWAMFIGWVGFYSQIGTLRTAAINTTCILLGVLAGMAASSALALLTPYMGLFTLPLVVFMVGMVVISLRSLPVFCNLVCYFLGLISFFAAHLPIDLSSFITLGAAICLGAIAGLSAFKLQCYLK